MFNVTGSTVTFENPKMIIDGLMFCHEAHIEINAEKMSSGFLHLLMWHMGEGHIKVKVANTKENV